MKKFKYGKAVCYSGYRIGQSPHQNIFPSYDETKEDLLILEKDWDYIRMYDTSKHVRTTLQVIKDHNLKLKVMIGVDLRGESDNPNCAWGGDYDEETIKKNIEYNHESIENAIILANQYEDIIFSVSAGNEAVPDWNSDLVPPQKVLEYVKRLKNAVTQPVTYCDGFDYWLSSLEEVAKEVDFISIHTYPFWQGYTIDEGFKVASNDYLKVQEKYPEKYCIITETGWPTSSQTLKSEKGYVDENIQARFYHEITDWSLKNEILVFLFEAFDEPWKGGSSPMEPEKNWGLFKVDRLPKKSLK